MNVGGSPSMNFKKASLVLLVQNLLLWVYLLSIGKDFCLTNHGNQSGLFRIILQQPINFGE